MGTKTGVKFTPTGNKPAPSGGTVPKPTGWTGVRLSRQPKGGK